MHKKGNRRQGTNKGAEGMANFFRTHQCSPLCVRLGLKAFNGGTRGY